MGIGASSTYRWIQSYGSKPLALNPVGNNVGIGTASPGTTLDVAGNTQSSIFYDRDNTNYYLDPAANTMPYSLNAAGSGVFGGSIVAAGRGDTFMSYLGLDKDYNANNVGLYWNAKWNGDNPSTYNYINTGAWGGTASRLVASGNSLSYDQASGGTNPLTWTNRLTINSSGQVGIGTSPSYTLQVNGTIHTTAAASGNLGSTGYDLAGYSVGSQTLYSYGSMCAGNSSGQCNGSGGVVISAGGSPNTSATVGLSTGISFFNGGNVGVGTTGPGVKLDTRSGTNSAPATSGTSQPGAGLRVEGGDNAVIDIGTNSVNTWIQATDKTSLGLDYYLNLNPNGGNIGIGTTNPTTAGLVVATNVSGAGINVSNNRIINVGTPINAADAATKSYVDSAVATGVSGGVSGTTNYIPKFTGTNTVGNSAIYQSGSNIGIGTTGPATNLTVSGSEGLVDVGANGWVDPGATGGSIVADNGTYKALMIVGNNISGNSGNGREVGVWDFLNVHGRAAIGYSSQTAAPSSGLAVSGNVGINTTSPGTNLDVNGNIDVGSTLYDRANTNYYINPSGNVMPYAANLGGGLNVAGSAAISGTVTVGGGTGTVTTMSANGGFGGISGYFDCTYHGCDRGYIGHGVNFITGSSTASYQVASNYNGSLIYFGNSDWIGFAPINASNGTTFTESQLENTYTKFRVTDSGASVNGYFSVSGSMYSVGVNKGTVTGATTIDWSQGNTQTVVLGASPIALTFTNGQSGAHYTLDVQQDATGGRTITWPGNVRWSSGVAPTLTTTANKTDYVEFVYNSNFSSFDGVGFNANF